jgi:UDP-glucose 4-epimerase
VRACVIGGGGFIGGYLVEALIATGRDVLVLGRRSERPIGLNASASYRSCDYGDRNNLRQYICDCEEIIDLAYATIPQTSFENPIFDLQANLAPSLALLEEAKDLRRLRRLVVTSSGGTVYGPAARLPIIEEDRTAPISPYGITKLTIERYALMFHLLAELPVTIVRPANAYGLGQKPFMGQGFIATAMGRILRREPVTIFGEYGTIRDYVHVKDIASGILCAIENGRSGEIYNLGSGVGRSNRDVLTAIGPFAKRSGLTIEIECAQPRGFDVPANVLSFGKLLSHANWQPRIRFETGLLEMWEGMPAHLGVDG